MYHTLGHPDIIMFGLNSTAVMGQIINTIGEEVRQGAKLEDWHESDQVLDGYSCMFRTVPMDVYPDYVGYAMWYYQPDPFPVLQCVWPDAQHNFPWHPDCHPEVRERQPILSQQVGWPFLEAKNRAVFTTTNVLAGTHPILIVSHDKDGDWQFLCGTTNRSEDGKVVSLESVFKLHPSIAEVADLPEGWRAVRDTEEGPWRRMHVG